MCHQCVRYVGDNNTNTTNNNNHNHNHNHNIHNHHHNRNQLRVKALSSELEAMKAAAAKGAPERVAALQVSGGQHSSNNSAAPASE